jgi:tetratricopeptide (TPR) repeat protein
MPNDIVGPARGATNRALELDPNSAVAHAMSGDLMISYENNYADAREVFERALELDPFNVDVLYQASIYYAFIGQPEKALPLALAAYDRDPLFTANHATLGYVYNMLGRYDEAFDIIKKRVAIAPESYGTYSYLANPLIMQGRYEEALEWTEKERLDGFRYTSLAIIHWHLGNRAESDDAMAKLLAQQSGGWDWQAVEAHAVRGEIDEAFAAMEAAYDNRDSGLQLILGDRHVANLRDDPRYEEMVRRIGLPID